MTGLDDLELLHLGILQLGLANNPLLSKFLALSQLDTTKIFAVLSQTKTPAKDTKALLAKTQDIFDEIYLEGADIQALLALKAWLMDQILAALCYRIGAGKTWSTLE